MGTTHVIGAGSGAALPVAVDLAGRTAKATPAVICAFGTTHAVVADLIGVAASTAANCLPGAALFRALSIESSCPEAKGGQHCASDRTADHAKNSAP